jgi:hypothetical protein
MTDLTTVSFAVPSRHAVEFQMRAYAILAELTNVGAADRRAAPPDRARPAFTPLSSEEVRGSDVWTLPRWQADDHERAMWLADSLPVHPKAALALLCERAGTWVNGTKIAEALGLAHGAKSVPPSFKSIANRCRRADRRPVWDYDPEQGYRVNRDIAALFTGVLDL